MKRKALLLLLVFALSEARAQIPVIDASNLAQLVAIVAKVQQQINLARSQLGVIRSIQSLSQRQLSTLTDQLAFDRQQAVGFAATVLPHLATGSVLQSIRLELYRRTGIVPVSVAEVQGILAAIEQQARQGDLMAVIETAKRGHQRIEQSVRATIGALEGHQSQLAQSSAELDQINALLRSAATDRQQQQVQAMAAAATAREAILLRDVLNRQTYLMALEQQRQQLLLEQQRALQRGLVGEQ